MNIFIIHFINIDDILLYFFNFEMLKKMIIWFFLSILPSLLKLFLIFNLNAKSKA